MALKFNGLALEITNRCNARCSHCYGSYGSEGRLRLPVNEAISLIDAASTIKSIGRELAIAGGEAFLAYEDLLAIIRHAANQGFRPSITTNAFWGRSFKRAIDWMTRLKDAGLVKLEISVDSFHQKYVPIASPRNVIRAARQYGLETIMLRCEVTRHNTLEKILVDLDVIDLANTIVVSSPVVPMGRAKEEIPAGAFFIESARPLGCCKDALILTVTSEGDAFPCCAGSELCPSLRLGNIHGQSLHEIESRAQVNYVLRTLVTVGPSCLAESIAEHGLGHLLLPGYTNACHLCTHVFTNPQLAEWIASFVDRHASAILADLVHPRQEPRGYV